MNSQIAWGNIWMVSGWAVGAIEFELGVPDLRVRHAPLEENPQMSHQYCLPGGLGCNWGVFQPSPAGLHPGSFFVDMPHGRLWILPLAWWLAIHLLLAPCAIHCRRWVFLRVTSSFFRTHSLSSDFSIHSLVLDYNSNPISRFK